MVLKIIVFNSSQAVNGYNKKKKNQAEIHISFHFFFSDEIILFEKR